VGAPKKKSEQDVWERNEQKTEKELLREIYQKSLLALSSFIAAENDSDDGSSISNDARRKYIADIQEWTTMLQIRHSDEALSHFLSCFMRDLDTHEARRLYERVLELSNLEQSFFISEILSEPKIATKEVDRSHSLRHITYKIDEDFRKVALTGGLDLPQNSGFDIELNQITEPQRQALADSYFASYKTIPLNLNLSLPDYQTGWTDIRMVGRPWYAKLNPFESDANIVLDAWETDFKLALAETREKAPKTKTE